MNNMPAIKANKLKSAVAGYVNAAEAVREGIATHVQKHRAAQHAARKAAEAARKLNQEN